MDKVAGIPFERLSLLIGSRGLESLAASTVAVFGLGGVGSFAGEALARSGVGGFLLLDFDTVSESNLNRQVTATRECLGMSKARAMELRIKSINPDARVSVIPEFVDDALFDSLVERDGSGMAGMNFCVEAIDSLGPKVHLIRKLIAHGIPFVSSMGAGGRLNPFLVQSGPLSDVSCCSLAQRLKKALRKEGVDISKVSVVYSDEKGIKPLAREQWGARELNRGRVRGKQGSSCFVPAVFGMGMAYVAVMHIVERGNNIPG